MLSRRVDIKAVALLILTLLSPVAARADSAESWTWSDMRLPIPDGGGWKPSRLHLVTDVRIGTRYPGIGFLSLQAGPMWDVHKYLLLGVHVRAVALQRTPAVFSNEYRTDVEPHLRWNSGPVSINDRSRLEFRWINGAFAWRYRNQLRINYELGKTQLAPYVWDELFVDFTLGYIPENRAAIGLGWTFMEGARLDVGYIWRARRPTATTWANDNILNVQVVFQPRAPEKEKAD